MVMRSYLSFQGSRPGLFYDLSVGDFCPLRIPLINQGLRLPPQISREKDSGLRLVAGHQSLQKRPHAPSRYCKLFYALSSNSFYMAERDFSIYRRGLIKVAGMT